MYIPAQHDDPCVLKNEDVRSDPVHVAPDILRARYSWSVVTGTLQPMTNLSFDRNGNPQNPTIFTNGRVGRGTLDKWAVNHMSELLLTRRGIQDDGYQVLVVPREELHGWTMALPGGMVDVQYATKCPDVLAITVQNDMFEEASGETLRALLHKGGKIVYCGPVDDPRNTRNAWIETQVIHVHLDEAEAVVLGKDTTGTWMDVTEETTDAMYSNHGTLVQYALFLLEKPMRRRRRLLVEIAFRTGALLLLVLVYNIFSLVASLLSVRVFEEV